MNMSFGNIVKNDKKLKLCKVLKSFVSNLNPKHFTIS